MKTKGKDVFQYVKDLFADSTLTRYPLFPSSTGSDIKKITSKDENTP